jgi:ATP-dependent DNA helicase RecG
MEIGSSPLTETSIRSVKGVGPKIVEILQNRDIRTTEDLFYFCPTRYEDRRVILNIGAIREGERATILGRVVTSKEHFSRASRKRLRTAVLDDGTGTVILKWFRFVRQYLRTLCRKGNLLLVTGEVRRFGDALEMVHPDVFLVEDEHDVGERQGVLPVYPEIEGLKQGTLRRIIKEAFDECGGSIRSSIPVHVEKEQALPTLKDALACLHFPDESILTESSQEHYRKRLILEEFFLFQAALLLKGREIKRDRGISLKSGGPFFSSFKASLPFQLTPAQKRALEEITSDMKKPEPMNRLLQGDVGCGKTVCAVAAACVALDSGYQVAFLAPTEILAEQQYLTIHRSFEALGIRPVLLRGGLGRQDRESLLKGIHEGTIPIIVGTHAVLQNDIKFKNLGFAVIDEQHRFGVLQRKTLMGKGISPDMLVMTATPIPRTLAMVVFGDLDVSVIDGMPEGRQKIVTRIFSEAGRDKAYKLVEVELRAGRQAFFVYPLVDESDKSELLAATRMASHLKEIVFPHYRIGLLHGRMKAEEKEEIMLSFRQGNIDILACTTVVEVGIDIPNATVMVVEHAERFGLSQLHQLRGRIGRGSYPSKCILIAAAGQTTTAKRRLRIMEETQDGFRIAEEDMNIRGPGDMLGVRQAGIPRFRIGDIMRNGDIMGCARAMAEIWLADAPASELARVGQESMRRWGKNLELYEVL